MRGEGEVCCSSHGADVSIIAELVVTFGAVSGEGTEMVWLAVE